MVKNPETISKTVVRHPVNVHDRCGKMLTNAAMDAVRPHQLFDIPPLNITVTENRHAAKTCLRCHAKIVGSFSEGM